MKRTVSFALALMLVFCAVSVFADEIEVSAPYALLIDLNTGKTIFEREADARVFPASTTKIMAAVLVLESLEMDEVLTASQTAIQAVPYGYTQIGLLVGEQLTVRELLYALMLDSASDAANVLAERVSGSIEGFVAQMNQKAYELGMESTHFTNTYGVHDEQHFTTARDMARLTMYAMKNEDFRAIVKTPTYIIEPTEQYTEVRRLHNTNLLIDNTKVGGYIYPYATGVKTGFTNAAGYCLVASAQKDGMEFAALIFGAASSGNRRMQFDDAINMFDYAFANYAMTTVISDGELITQSPIRAARGEKAVLLKADGSLSVLSKNGETLGEITHVDTVDEKIVAPVAAGTVLGTSEYFVGGESIGTVNLIADRDYAFDPVSYVFGGFWRFISSPWFFVPLILILVILAWIRQYRYEQRRRRRIERERLARGDYRG